MYKGLIDRYFKYLPIKEGEKIISLNEGDTPLIRAINLERDLPGMEIYLKYDGLNPTGSFKDRGMTMAVTRAYNDGSRSVICASTGNTSAAAAAYAARAGMKCFVVIPDGKIAIGKLAQALIYGAKVLPIKGNFDEALQIVRRISEETSVTLVNSINPYRIEGQKTASYEILDQLGQAPDYLVLPIGNAGNITAYFKGFQENVETGRCAMPRFFGFQAAGAAPIVEGRVIEHPETIATAIRIGNPASWQSAKQALEKSHGEIDKIEDEDILKAQRLLASKEGVFAEPASCISLAGLLQAYKTGTIKSGKAVLILTGNGLKDPDSATSGFEEFKAIDSDYEKILAQIGS
ncbi:MAG: threonine synthase [Bacillota bacterium]|nr:threonine synthase [Bacillota bacterium]